MNDYYSSKEYILEEELCFYRKYKDQAEKQAINIDKYNYKEEQFNDYHKAVLLFLYERGYEFENDIISMLGVSKKEFEDIVQYLIDIGLVMREKYPYATIYYRIFRMKGY